MVPRTVFSVFVPHQPWLASRVWSTALTLPSSGGVVTSHASADHEPRGDDLEDRSRKAVCQAGRVFVGFPSNFL